ncbi:MAG: hypothetical protein AMXMBFR78_06500 [Rubrivivax sp.]
MPRAGSSGLAAEPEKRIGGMKRVRLIARCSQGRRPGLQEGRAMLPERRPGAAMKGHARGHGGPRDATRGLHGAGRTRAALEVRRRAPIIRLLALARLEC